MRNQHNKPKWCPNTIATVYGWADSITGELLVSIKGLKDPVEGYVRNRPLKFRGKPTLRNALKEIRTEEDPPKRKPGRPKKSQ